MNVNDRKHPEHHGYGEVAVSRYLALYLAQAGWLVLGVFLFMNAYWPSSCRPHGFIEVYTCSMRLADSRTWVESALLTWLWGTPILVVLEIMRHTRKAQR